MQLVGVEVVGWAGGVHSHLLCSPLSHLPIHCTSHCLNIA